MPTWLNLQDDVSVRALVDKACEPFYVLADVRGQSIIRDVKDESFTGDIGWSCEALGNLIKNSIEHTPAGGKILIRAVENDIYTEITVEDSGEGFTEGDIRHLFERFYRERIPRLKCRNRACTGKHNHIEAERHYQGRECRQRRCEICH